MKRLLSLLLALLMVASLAACGEKSGTPAAEPSAPASGSQPAAQSAADQPAAQTKGEPKLINDDTSISGTVRFWIPFKGNQGMDDMIADFNKTYPNIQVELTPYSNNSDGNMSVNTSLMACEIDVLWSFELHNT